VKLSTISSLHDSALNHYHAARFPEARAALSQALVLLPSLAEALQLLAVVAFAGKDYVPALRFIDRAIGVDPGNSTHYQNAGPILKALRRFDDALLAIRRSVLIAPEVAGNYNNLGTLLHDSGKYSDAVACFDRARAIDANDPIVEYNAGGVFCDWGRLGQSAQRLQRALYLRPDYAEAYNRLGKVYRLERLLGAAARCHRCAVVLMPENPAPYANLAGICKLHAQSAQAITLYRRSLAIRPDSADTFSNMLFAMQYSDEQSSQDIASAHECYGERFEAPLRQAWSPHLNSRDADRPLKIGYVSADFNLHATSYFIEPVFAHHDAARFDIHCYSNSTVRDHVTDRMRASAGHWVACHSMSDDQLARQIREDCIDILVDLSGHTAGNRLLAFARKPAPIQLTWLGYFGPTGLASMDYRFTDACMDPVGNGGIHEAERPLRLPHFAPFQPFVESPPLNRLPALASGTLTLASLNNLAKLNHRVVRLWARILAALPGARLMLCNIGDVETRQRVTEIFASSGISPERLSLQPWLPVADYLALHHEIDLALDPFPYNGGATTSHSLWMGVPVVTLAGSRPVARIGASLMNRAKLPEFVVGSEEEYLACVLRVAGNLPVLEEIRLGLRDRLVSNADASAEAMTRAVERAYRDIWRAWCGT